MPPLRRVLRVVGVVAMAVLVAGCQVKATVNTQVNDDGTGTIAVGLGLDDKALARTGNLDRVVRVDDMKAVGWVVTPAIKEPDGLTWLRATKSFANPAEAVAITASLSPAAFKEFALQKDEGLGKTTWTYSGTVDLTKGIDTFAEPELATALGSDPFGGWIPEIEKAEGKKATDMVTLTVGVGLPGGEPQTYSPKLGDPEPLAISTSADQRTGLPIPLGGVASGSLGWLILLGLGGAGIVALALLRQRFRAVGH